MRITATITPMVTLRAPKMRPTGNMTIMKVVKGRTSTSSKARILFHIVKAIRIVMNSLFEMSKYCTLGLEWVAVDSFRKLGITA